MKISKPLPKYSLTRFALNLPPAEQARLIELTNELGLNRTEVIRALIRNAHVTPDELKPTVLNWLTSSTMFVKREIRSKFRKGEITNA